MVSPSCKLIYTQGSKKVQSSSLGQVGFLAGQVTFKHLPNGLARVQACHV